MSATQAGDQAAWSVHGVVPDVVPSAPAATATINWGPSASAVQCNLGNELTPTQVADIPTNVMWSGSNEKLYTLLLVDPDAPSRKEPKFRNWRHWTIVNIPGNDLAKGETIAEYIPSAPPENTDLHRYVFLIYEQDNKIDASTQKKLTNRSADGRGGFNVAEWLPSVGGSNWPLVAGNFYAAKWDAHVPKVYEQLKG